MRRAHRTTRLRHRSPGGARLSLHALVVATAVAFAGGAVSGVAVVTAEQQDARARISAAELRERADRAATVRLTAEATRYAAVRQEQALTAARTALADAEAVLSAAPTIVGPETVAPLDEAVAELSALVAGLVPELPSIDAASVEPVVDPDPAQPTPAPVEQAVPGDGTPTPGAGRTVTGPAPSATATPADDSPAATARALAGVHDDVLDLDTSAALLAAAQRVAALAAQVDALSADLAAELAAAAEAAEARRAEEEAARAAERARRIEATDAAPNGRIPLDLLCRPAFTSVLLRCDAAEALDELNAAYRASFGRDLRVSGGYRTLDEQYEARATKGDLAAEPGTSKHGRGLAVDFSGFGAVGQFDDPDYLWMVDRAADFGWVHPPGMGPGGSGPLEPWHWEFVGR